MTGKQKLELTWIGKDKRPKLEARILLEDGARSYHAGQRVSEGDVFDNRLIFGDNLLDLTLKKIPKMILARCEWGQDDYSLNVANLPLSKPQPQAPSTETPPQPAPKGKGRKAAATPDLFGNDGEKV